MWGELFWSFNDMDYKVEKKTFDYLELSEHHLFSLSLPSINWNYWSISTVRGCLKILLNVYRETFSVVFLQPRWHRQDRVCCGSDFPHQQPQSLVKQIVTIRPSSPSFIFHPSWLNPNLMPMKDVKRFSWHPIITKVHPLGPNTNPVYPVIQ